MYINGIAGEGQIVWGKMKEGRGERGQQAQIGEIRTPGRPGAGFGINR